MYDKSLAGTRQQKKNNTGPGIFAGPGAGGGALFAFDSWQCTKSHFFAANSPEKSKNVTKIKNLLNR